MGLFKSKEEKELDDIILRLEMNMSNNYKDNAQANLKELEAAMTAMQSAGGKGQKIASKYQSKLNAYKEKMIGFTHKDQKPYWH